MDRPDRRRPDPSTIQAWEALQATEAELSAARAKLASVCEALAAAREREAQLLRILERRQVRLPQLVMTVAATAALAVILTLVAVHYFDVSWPNGDARTAAAERTIEVADQRRVQ